MKRNYEIALMQHVSGSDEHDYETTAFTTTYKGYRAGRRLAKEVSKHIGETRVMGFEFPKRDGYQPLDAGLAAVKIVCYTEAYGTTYYPLYYEYYRDGKVEYKDTFDD